MNSADLKRRIVRARELLAGIHHVAIATVNDDGSPHNSPVFMAFDDVLNGYWASHPESLHSRNIARDGKVFLVIFDSREGPGGLFIEATAGELTDISAIKNAHGLLKALKEQMYGSMGDIEMYTKEQRLYCAKPLRAWVNHSERDASGVIIRDIRHEVPISSLAI